jgi:hypothetical protein
MPKHHYGWRRQQPDHRDWKFVPARRVLANLPPAIDLSAHLGPVLDQGQLGSCGPNSADGHIMYDQEVEGYQPDPASRLFIYYTTRMLMGTVAQDSGVDNRTMLKALAQYGYCDEALWPYDIAQFTARPPQAFFDAALANRISSYAAVSQDLDTMRGTLAAGFCFLYGFTVYESLESQQVEQTGDVPMPGPNEQVLGGHDVLVYGYDDATQRFKFRNSWGLGWGRGGNPGGRAREARRLPAAARSVRGQGGGVEAVPGLRDPAPRSPGQQRGLRRDPAEARATRGDGSSEADPRTSRRRPSGNFGVTVVSAYRGRCR